MEPPKNVEVHDETTSTWWVGEDGIFYSVSKNVPPESREMAEKRLENLKKVVGDKKLCMLLDITNAQPSRKEDRDWAAEELNKLVKAMALISDKPLGKMIANLFFALKPPPYPVKMFSNVEGAREWLKKYL